MSASPDTLLNAPALKAAKEVTFGSIAGMASKVLEHPFDLTKVRLQAQVLHLAHTETKYNGPVDCLTQTWRNEGIRGLYRGLPVPVIGAMAENASLFLSYAEFKDLIKKMTQTQDLSITQLVLAGAGSGAVTSLVLTPIELIKCRMQVQMIAPGSSSPTGSIPLILSIVRSTGLRGLWVGQIATLLRETGGTAAWFGTKEVVASLLIARDGGNKGKRALKPWESALAGAFAGAAFNISLFPADTVKSVMQTQEEMRSRRMASFPGQGSLSEKPTFYNTFRALWKVQGVRGLYAGMGVTIARSLPSSGMIFLIHDELEKRFG